LPLITDIIDSVFPSNNAEGIVLTDTIRITFDREMDENSLAENIIVEGLDKDEIVFLSYMPSVLVSGDEESLLESPEYAGIATTTATFKRLALLTTDEVQTLDEVGNGSLFRTQVIIKPSIPFAPDRTYRIHIVGDQDLDDDSEFGVRSRSVFDPVEGVSNTSTGVPTITGTYTGAYSNDTLNIRIVDPGMLGVATFEWWLSSVPFELHGPATTHVNKSNLIAGTDISFSNGEYVTGDTWTVYLGRYELFEGQVIYTFSTGGGNILPVEDSTSTSPTGIPLTLTSDNSLTVIKTTPADMAVNQPVENYDRIVIEFNKDIDPNSVTADMITVIATPVIDHPSLCVNSPNGPIAKIITVEGNKIFIDV
jgi:hypothetical protein